VTFKISDNVDVVRSTKQQRSGLDTTISIPKKNTARRYKIFIDRFCNEFGNDDINQINSDDVLSFLNRKTEGNKLYTKRIRYAQLSAFFNFIRSNIDHESSNPCDTPMIRKLYRAKGGIEVEDHRKRNC
jgi:hypothetical protein